MILVEPEIIKHHEHPSVSSLLQHIQERSDADKDGWTLLFYHTFTISILDVEFSTLYAVSLCLVAGFASPIAVLFTNPIVKEDILDTVSGIPDAFSSFLGIA